MEIKELHQKCLELKLKQGDPILLIYSWGKEEPAVFKESRFRADFHERFSHSLFDYLTLSGVCISRIGSSRNRNLNFDLTYCDIRKWEPITTEEKDQVAKIQEDLKNKTYRYIS